MYNLDMKAKDILFKKLKSLTKESFDEKSDIYNIGIDSLDLVELVTEIEDEYEIQISDEELLQFKLVKDIINALEEKLK